MNRMNLTLFAHKIRTYTPTALTIKVNMPLHEFRTGLYKEIGTIESGGQGTVSVFALRNLKDQRLNLPYQVAVKTLLASPDERRWKRELQLLKSLNHVNVVKFFASRKEPSIIRLYMELCHTNLLRLVANNIHSRGEEFVRLICAQCLNGLNYLHSHNIVHRDIKPQNVLVLMGLNGHVTVKLADFGMAKAFDDQCRLFSTEKGVALGTRMYMAPEILDLAKRGTKGCVEAYKKADMFGMGLVFTFVCVGRQPNSDLRSYIRDAKSLISHLNPGLVKLISDLVEFDPNLRPSVVAALDQFADVLEVLESSNLQSSKAVQVPDDKDEIKTSSLVEDLLPNMIMDNLQSCVTELSRVQDLKLLASQVGKIKTLINVIDTSISDKTVWQDESLNCQKEVLAMALAMNRLICGLTDGSIKVFNGSTLVQDLQGQHKKAVVIVRVLGDLVVTGSSDSTIILWRLDISIKSLELLHRMKMNSAFCELRLDLSISQVVSCGHHYPNKFASQICVWSWTANCHQLPELKLQKEVVGLYIDVAFFGDDMVVCSVDFEASQGWILMHKLLSNELHQIRKVRVAQTSIFKLEVRGSRIFFGTFDHGVVQQTNPDLTLVRTLVDADGVKLNAFILRGQHLFCRTEVGKIVRFNLADITLTPAKLNQGQDVAEGLGYDECWSPFLLVASDSHTLTYSAQNPSKVIVTRYQCSS